MAGIVPIIEVSQHGNSLGVGSPDGEMGSVDTIEAHRVGAELIVEPKVAPFIEQIDVMIAE